MEREASPPSQQPTHDFVKLTLVGGTPVWVNLTRVDSIQPGGASTHVHMSDGTIYVVQELPEDILPANSPPREADEPADKR